MDLFSEVLSNAAFAGYRALTTASRFVSRRTITQPVPAPQPVPVPPPAPAPALAEGLMHARPLGEFALEPLLIKPWFNKTLNDHLENVM
jgi:hypothetical protein